MNQLIVIPVIYFLTIILASFVILNAMKNMRNQIQKKVSQGMFIKGVLTDKGKVTKKAMSFRQHYACINNKKYILPLSELDRLEIGKCYYFILNEDDNKVLIVKDSIDKYKRKVTLKEYVTEIIKSTKIYKALKD